MMSCVRRLGLTVVFLLVIAAVAVPTHAQTPGAAQTPAQTPATTQTQTFPTFEVTGGYQVLHVPDQWFPFGLNIDGAWNSSSALGLVGEVGWAFDSEDDVNFHAWNIGFGPRFNGRPGGRFWPFAQILVGALHARGSVEIAGVDVSDSATHFMLQPGVGANIIGGDGWGIVGQVDYRRVFFGDDDEDDEDLGDDDEDGENEFRVFIGLRLLLD